MAAPDSHRGNCSLDISVAIPDDSTILCPNEYSKKCLSPNTVYSYPDSSSNDSSPFFTPSSRSPCSSSNQKNPLTSAEFVASAISSNGHIMMNVTDDINIYRREKNGESDIICVNEDNNSYNKCNCYTSGIGRFHSHNLSHNCSTNNSNDTCSNNGNCEVSGSKSIDEAQKIRGNVETGCIENRKTTGISTQLAEVNSLGTEWAGAKFLPAQLELWPSQTSCEIEPVISELFGSTSCCTEEKEGAQIPDQSDRTWSNFEKYGIDIDLFVGSSRLSPVHSSWYSSSSSNYRQGMESSQGGIEESNECLANLFSGFDMSNIEEGEFHRFPEDVGVRADAAEVLPARGWSVSSPCTRSDIESPIRNSIRSQSARLTGEKSVRHRGTGSESSRLRDDSQEERPGDQLQYTRLPLGALGGKRSTGGKLSSFRFPVFWHSHSVNSSINSKVTKSTSDVSQSDVTGSDMSRSYVSQSDVSLSDVSGSDVSHALSQSVSEELGDRRQRSKSRKRMMSSFKRWLSGTAEFPSNEASLHR